jgi:hypothetical protein
MHTTSQIMRNTDKKGTEVTHTNHPTETLSTSGSAATLRDFPSRSRSGGHPTGHPVSMALLLTVLGALLLFAFPTSSAFARQARLFAGTFGGATSTTPNPYPLSDPWSVVVDHSKGPSRGNVYVADVGNHRVEKFDSSGHLILMFGKGVNKTAVEEGKPEAQQNVCLAAEVCQTGTAGSTPGAFQSKSLDSRAQTFFLAVDSSSGPSAGDVYVADPSDSKGNGVDVVTKFDEGGHVVSAWGTAGQLTGSGLAQGPFWDLAGVAVDPSGNLWVLGRINGSTFDRAYAQVFEFSQEAGLITSWNLNPNEQHTEIPSFENPDGLAVDSLDHLYFLEERASGGNLTVFDSSGARLGLITSVLFDPESGQRDPAFQNEDSGFEPTAFALDPSTNDIYLAATFPAGPLGPTVIRRYSAATCHPVPVPEILTASPGCTSTEYFGAGRLGKVTSGFNRRDVNGLALNPLAPGDALYAVMGEAGELTTFATLTVPDVSTAKATALFGSSARLNGTVNPSGEPLTRCFFEWAEGTEPYAHTAPCEAPDAAEVGAGSSLLEVHAQIPGLTASSTYHFRLVASNANTDLAEEPSQGQDLTFGPPQLLSTSALAVSSTAATLQLQLNPNDIETTYYFEYVTQGQFEALGFSEPFRTPAASAGSGDVDVTGAAQVQGLSPNTIYHYRVVATNSLGTVEGPDHAFTTQGAPAFVLSDGRQWEQVSPPNKHGAPLEPIRSGVIQAATDGTGIAYFADAPIDLEAPGTLSPVESQFLARRGPAGWTTQDITTPHQVPTGLNVGNLSEYKLFSANLSLGVVAPFGATPLSPQTTEPTPYLRQPDGTYLPLVSAANVPEGVKFDGKEISPEDFEASVSFLTATPDFAHVLLGAEAPLTADYKPSFKPAGRDIYEWSEGALQLVSWVPSAATSFCGGTGPACVPAGEKKESSEVGAVSFKFLHNAISTDGSRVAFGTSSQALYLRDLVRGETIQLDAAQPGAEGKSGGGTFAGASADGSRVFFTDTSRLTTDSTAQEGRTPDLYMCQVGEEAGHLACALKDLSVDHNPGESAVVLGVIGSSEDGSSVYFVAQGVLAAGAVHGGACFQFQTASGECNLYRYDTATESTALVAVLSGADEASWGGIGLEGEARVSPNGRYVAFMSQRSLTGYDNRDATSGVPDEEVYLYDSQASPGAQLVCASCNPTGARPHGVLDEFTYPGLRVDLSKSWVPHHTLAGSVPDRPSGDGLHYQSRYLSNSGRLFFNSADALVPQDTNGVEDVYEYEPPQGPGQPADNSCTSASVSYSSSSRGCISLISSGSSPEESAFLDASESGDDVFFLTASKLTSGDIDGALDVYDAHACSEASPCPPPPPPPPPACTGDACQNLVEAPNDPTPGSLTFSGPGNPTVALTTPKHTTTRKTVKCKKPKKLNHGKCVNSKKKAKKAKKAKRAANERRAKR